MSPSLLLNASAALLTRDGGGSSVMNRRASFKETKRAVEGWWDKEINDAQAVFHSSSRRDAIAENDLLAVVVDPRFEIEAAFAARLADRPAGQATGHLLDVPLGITAIDAKRVQFHKLAGVVFIQSPSPVVGASHPRGRRVGIGAQPIVEIKEHRRTLRRSEQEVAETAQGMGSNGVPVVSGGQPTIGSLRGENIESGCSKNPP